MSRIQELKIEWTKDYDKFSLYKNNRVIDEKHLKSKIKPSLEKYGWIETSPMIVDGFFQIKDGQHRFSVAKEMGISIPYIITEKYTNDVVFALNNNLKAWTMQDKIYTTGKFGDVACEKISFLMEKYNVCLSVVARTINQSDFCRRDNVKYKDFDLDSADTQLNKAFSIYNIIFPIISDPYRSPRTDTKLITSIIKILQNKQISYQRFYMKTQKFSGVMHKCHTERAYIEILEKIYNYQERAENRMSFSIFYKK